MSLLWLSVVFFLAPAFADDCDSAYQAMIYQYQRGSLGLEDDPVRAILAERPHLKSKIHALETDVVDLFLLEPGQRGELLEAFKMYYGFSDDQARDILTYYGLRLFTDDAQIVGDPGEVMSRLRGVAREHALTDSGNPLSHRYLYYLYNVGRKSVPEMAAELKISPDQVYSELSTTQVSIDKSFQTPVNGEARLIDEILQRFEKGQELTDIASDLKVSPQAIRFYLHYLRFINRGTPWNRTVSYEGANYDETVLLHRLHNAGKTAAEIANILNKGTDSESPASLTHRTSAGVSMKIGLEGLGEDRTLLPEVLIPGYGMVKQKGVLLLDPAKRFILDNLSLGPENLAKQLGVTQSTLQRFMAKHDVFQADVAKRLLTSNLLKLYADQKGEEASARDLNEWWKQHKSLPSTSKVGSEENRLWQRMKSHAAKPKFQEGLNPPVREALQAWLAKKANTASPPKLLAEELNQFGKNSENRIPQMQRPKTNDPNYEALKSEANLYARMLKFAEDPELLQYLNPEVRLNFVKWNAERLALQSDNVISDTARAVNKMFETEGRLPKDYRRTELTDEMKEEKKYFKRMRSHQDNPEFLKALNPEAREAVEKWKASVKAKQGTTGPEVTAKEVNEYFTEHGRIPGARKPGEARLLERTPEEQALSTRLLDHRKKKAFLDSLDPQVRLAFDKYVETVEDRAPLTGMQLAEFLNSAITANQGKMPVRSKKKAADKTPEEVKQDRYLISVDRLADDPEFLANLTPESRKAFDFWKSDRERKNSYRGAKGAALELNDHVQKTGAMPNQLSREGKALYQRYLNYRNDPDFVNALSESSKALLPK